MSHKYYVMSNGSFGTIDDVELAHAVKSGLGKPKSNHKYIDRKWVKGKWVYTYPDEKKTSGKSISDISKANAAKSASSDKILYDFGKQPEGGSFYKKTGKTLYDVAQKTGESVYNSKSKSSGESTLYKNTGKTLFDIAKENEAKKKESDKNMVDAVEKAVKEQKKNASATGLPKAEPVHDKNMFDAVEKALKEQKKKERQELFEATVDKAKTALKSFSDKAKDWLSDLKVTNNTTISGLTDEDWANSLEYRDKKEKREELERNLGLGHDTSISSLTKDELEEIEKKRKKR